MIKNWKMFNEELSPGVYRSASYKLDRMGHKNRSKALIKHSEDMLAREAKEKWGIGEVEFEGGVIAEFTGFGFAETWDLWVDNEREFIGAHLFFKFPIEWDGSNIYNITFALTDDKSGFEMLSYDEEAFEESYGKKVLKFGNRRDAVKIINTLKNADLSKEITNRNYTEEEFNHFVEDFNNLLSKIRINEIYK